MQYLKNSFLILVLMSILVVPVFAFAQSGLIPCGTERTPIDANGDGKTDVDSNGVPTGGQIQNPCHIEDVYTLVNNVVDFLLKDFAIPVAAVGMFYAGVLMIFSGGSDEGKTKAKKIFTGVVLGLIFIAGSWLIVKTVLVIVGYKDIGAIF